MNYEILTAGLYHLVNKCQSLIEFVSMGKTWGIGHPEHVIGLGAYDICNCTSDCYLYPLNLVKDELTELPVKLVQAYSTA